MKKTVLNLLCILLFACCNGQNNSISIFYTPVNMPASLKNNYYGMFDTRLLAEDLASLLKRATGKSFVAMPWAPGVKTGIFLVLDSNNTSLGNEEGFINDDGKNSIRITGRYTTGISYAMYSWLEEIGFHFYLPGEEWTIVPKVQSLFSKNSKTKSYKPYFHIRMFGPSGSIYAVKGLDEKMQNWQDWKQWYIRNRMGCDYIRVDGHIGEVFNVTHRKEIEADTSIVAPFKGKRQYATGAKLDPTYKKGVDMFTDWLVSEFVKQRSSFPSFLPFKKYYTSDAGDGLDYCHSAECERQFKTVSDQVFSITNEAARKIKLADSRAAVSAMAYGERADTPNIKLESNVQVMIVPNAFQSVTTAAELMKQWAIKTNDLSIYDYLNIGVWGQDMPFFDMYQYHNWLKFLQSLNIEGVSYETSLSKFGSGIQQYLILKFLCEPYTSVDIVLKDFCKINFGNAAIPIEKLLKEWYFSNVHLKTLYNYPSFYEDELGRFVQYIVEAENAGGLSPAIKVRIDELKAYTIYLCKFYERFSELKSLQDFSIDSSLKTKKTEDLLTYSWQLYHTKIFHNTQLNETLKRSLNDQQKEKWNYSKSDHFFEITAGVASVVKNDFENIKKKYLPLAVAAFPVTDSFLLANARFSADSFRIATADEQALADFIYPFEFYCASPGTLKINYQAGKSQLKEKAGRIAIVNVESADYKFTRSYFISSQESNGSFLFQLPAKGHYRLYLSRYNATHISYTIYPGTNLFYHHKKSILMNAMLMQDQDEKGLYPNRYLAFYAPPTDSIYFSNLYISSKNTSSLYTASGKSISVQPGRQAFYNSAAVPKNEKYNFIFYENSLFRWPPVLKNSPPYYFFLKYPLN